MCPVIFLFEFKTDLSEFSPMNKKSFQLEGCPGNISSNKEVNKTGNFGRVPES